MRHRRAAIRAWRSYRGAGAVTRAFLAARLAVLPLKPLAEEFARLRGRVLGVGSGHGIVARYLAELNRDVTVEGIDVDAARVAVATATEANAPRVRIHVADVRALAASDADAGAFDAVATVDLIHHLPPDDVALAAHAFARAVKPGGTLVIKDIARTPRWKHTVNRLHDRIVSGEATTAMDPLDLADLLSDAGFEIERLDRVAPLSPYPHFILRARRLA